MKFKVSLAQISPKSGDLYGNAAQILEGIERARKEECDLVVFPEMCLTGYCLDEKLLINPGFMRENQRLLMEQLVPASTGIAVVVGFIDFDPGRIGPDGRFIRHNAAAVFQDGKLVQVVHKRLLPAYRYFDDKRYFEPGYEAQPIELSLREGKVSLGVLICEDLWEEGYDFRPCSIYQQKGVDYFFCINASPFVGSHPGQCDGKRFSRAELISRQIQRYGIPVIYVNTVGIGDNGKNIIPFDGLSMAFDRRGSLVAALAQFEEDQKSVCFEDGVSSPVPEPPFDRDAEIYGALVMGVRDYFNKMGIFKKVLQTVSGGIDSALGTAIAFDAVGRDRLSVYNLPSDFNTPRTRDLAAQLASNFGLDYRVIPIQYILQQVVADFEKHLHPIQCGVTVENLQSRIRGLIMMAESNDQQALLLTNGNETEIALGYATLYGDMVGGLSVIGDLAKPDVYRLARYVNRKWGRPMIPEGIFDLVPSAELRENQSDPFDYSVVGPLISEFIEKGFGPAEVVEEFEKRTLSESFSQASVYDRYSVESFRALASALYRCLNQSVYKRLQGAPIIVVSERAFGFDLRETIINGWTG